MSEGPGKEGSPSAGAGVEVGEDGVGGVGSREIYRGRIVHLFVDRVRFPDGRDGELELIRHPGASAVVPFLDPPGEPDPRILLIRQYRYAAGGYIYEVPAGIPEAGEDPEVCAARELREETGWRAGQLTRMTSLLTTPGFTDERIHLFAATDLEPGTATHDHDEFLTVEPHRLRAVRRMIREERIVDGKSLVALLWADRFLVERDASPL